VPDEVGVVVLAEEFCGADLHLAVPALAHRFDERDGRCRRSMGLRSARWCWERWGRTSI